MAEIRIRQVSDVKNEHTDIVDERQMMLIGFINDSWHVAERYPLPLVDRMFARNIRSNLDTQRQTVQGIIPDDFISERYDEYVEGNWAGWVTLPEGVNHGWGSIYTGQGNHSGKFGGYVLEHPVLPYDTNKELAIVRDYDNSSVITTLEGGKFEGLHLAYNNPEYITALGKVSVTDLYPQE